MPPNLEALGPRCCSGLDPASVPPSVPLHHGIAGPNPDVAGRSAARIPGSTNTLNLHEDMDCQPQIGLESCSSAQLCISMPTPAFQQEDVHRPQLPLGAANSSSSSCGFPKAPADALRGWTGPPDQPRIPRPSRQKIQNSIAATQQSGVLASTQFPDDIPEERSGNSPVSRDATRVQAGHERSPSRLSVFESIGSAAAKKHRDPSEGSTLPLPSASGRGGTFTRPSDSATAEESREATQYRVWKDTERQKDFKERSMSAVFVTHELWMPNESEDSEHHKPIMGTDEESLKPMADSMPSVMSRRRPVWGKGVKEGGQFVKVEGSLSKG